MNDVIALSELSDEPGTRGAYSIPSARLRAVLARITKHRAVRLESTLMSRGLLTLAALQAKSRRDLLQTGGLGLTYVTDIEQALEDYGLRLAGAEIVVRDHATPIEANAQRLQQWVEKRMAACESEMVNGDPHTNALERNRELVIEVDVLTDVMLILDGREPSVNRGWTTCDEFGCRREGGHEGPHQSSYIRNGFYEMKEWP